jgi:methyltransferase (TIGR00027 family)
MIEQYRPEKTRLFQDAVVKDLLGAPLRAILSLSAMRALTVQQTDAVAPGIYGAQVCRTRYIDDAVQAGLVQGIRQVIILGAGYDTRPYRLPGMSAARVFEVDLPSVQDDKKNKLQKHFGRLPENVTFIPIDFDTQALDSVFAATAFDPSEPAVFIWEGVTQYITAEAVRQTLAFVGKTVPGSSIVFTYVLKSVIERKSNLPGAVRMMDRVAQSSPWIFGLEPAAISSFLAPFHLALKADVGCSDYQTQYLQPMGRTLVVSEIERIVHAVVS